MATPGVEFEENSAQQPLTPEEAVAVREELEKTEAEIATLRDVLESRLRHAASLKRQLGITPLAELKSDLNKGLHTVTESQAYQKTAETVSSTWNAVKSSSAFQTLGGALQTAKMSASTSLDQIAGRLSGNPAGQPAQTPTTPTSPQ